MSNPNEEVAPPLMPDFSGGVSGICISKLRDPTLLDEMRQVIDAAFTHPVDHYVQMPLEAYRQVVSGAQDELNRRGLVRRLAVDQKDILERVVGTGSILLQSNLYLRATRPQIGPAIQENIGWHRETFYGPNMTATVNYWVPIKNVTPDSTMRYVPESHLIPDEDIATVNEDDTSVPRFSAGHKIGLLYSPKRILSGVDLSKSEAFPAKPGEAAIFSGQLIHGSATNRTRAIRFSVDFRLIAAANLNETKQHFASGKDYFEPL